MTQVSVQGGLYFPATQIVGLNPAGGAVFHTLDAATEKSAHMGHIYINGRGTGKVLSAAGGGSISFRLSTTTWADNTSKLSIGLQDVAAGAGPPMQPDGAFDVFRELTGGDGLITTASWNTVSMTGGSGSKTLNHGDLVAVVFDLTARGNVDSVLVGTSTATMGRGTAINFVGGVWVTTADEGPSVVITFDDGTLGIIDSTALPTLVQGGQESWDDADTPDERGLVFQVPWDCKIDAFYANIDTNVDATADFTVKFYTDPTGTPGLVTSVSVLSEQMLSFVTSLTCVFTLPSEVALTKNTNYGLTILPGGGTNDVELTAHALGNEAYRALWPGGTTVAKITRSDSTGAFSAENPAVTMYSLGVRISSFDDGTGSSHVAHGNMTGGLQ